MPPSRIRHSRRARQRQIALARHRHRVQLKKEADYLRTAERTRELSGYPRRSSRLRIKRINEKAGIVYAYALLYGEPGYFDTPLDPPPEPQVSGYRLCLDAYKA